MFRDLILWGDVNEIAVNPPTIVVEVFDKDIGVSFLIYLFVPLGPAGLSICLSVFQ